MKQYRNNHNPSTENKFGTITEMADKPDGDKFPDDLIGVDAFHKAMKNYRASQSIHIPLTFKTEKEVLVEGVDVEIKNKVLYRMPKDRIWESGFLQPHQVDSLKIQGYLIKEIPVAVPVAVPQNKSDEDWIIKEDNICPSTGEQCDDECCPIGAECNLRYDKGIISNCEPEQLPIEQVNVSKCNQCGGKKVLIRGKYPKDVAREICPTCTYEKLEMINEISSPYYNHAYQNI